MLLKLPDVIVLKSMCVLKNPTGDTNFQKTCFEFLLPLMELIPVAAVAVKFPDLLKLELELTGFEYPDLSCSFCFHFHLDTRYRLRECN